jgi:hypothetical protein
VHIDQCRTGPDADDELRRTERSRYRDRMKEFVYRDEQEERDDGSLAERENELTSRMEEQRQHEVADRSEGAER